MATTTKTIQQADAAICLPMSVPEMWLAPSLRRAGILPYLHSSSQEKTSRVLRSLGGTWGMDGAQDTGDGQGRDARTEAVVWHGLPRQGGQSSQRTSRGPQATDDVGRPAWFE
jgi:hypothetical protein